MTPEEGIIVEENKLVFEKNYIKLLDELITLSIKEYKDQKKKVISLDLNVLSTYDGSKGLKGKMQM